ncbi:tRNA (adenosine(37)-N6)-threonylcarbamoyltransferase complex dimerization subunit type 1 TsaB [Georgenia subflava]|uniref:tRNA (Adenosine(37)-N6)-threonylcarbamoyltransferase complex dimerization subunit type 1 TsaB n=1 Tax=Georgenia subflava TaxID=1622177 RepID=A0A6N7EM05_9MICO|nr:tRNA (adenosine(37)-N6)-threonylcarbamoyltransferase complex dimerization subunit type 1 TsaB [Georgenia subflava]MPV39090.1 tRNA (adenosine(37)-N6)-threonylcarbamoyltransferase complex dimerization subunit type 1 TsaB [Georgenia subflava]
MRILCLDTSGGSAVALVDTPAEGVTTVLRQAAGTDPRRHAESLAPLMTQVLGESREAVDAVAVGTGPAPFTGLRAGLVTAQAFARGRGIDVHGVCSLDVLARQALDVLGDDGEVLVATDARRKEVYWARYRSLGADDVERLAGPEVTTAEAAAAANDLGGATAPVVVGAGAALYPAHLSAGKGMPAAPDPAVLARLVRARLARRAAGDDVELGTEPRYLRRPDVQLPAAPKRAS